MIELVPGNGFRNEPEQLTVRDFDCPYCFGRGVHLEEVARDEIKETKCYACKGTKKLKAYVSIAWLPDKEDK